MKSSFWVLGSVTLLSLGIVRCSGHFLDNVENLLNETGHGDEERTLKDENTEWALYKARQFWNELTNEITELSSLARSEDTACKDVKCFEGGTCSGGICTCEENQYFDGTECKNFLCNLKDNKINCDCPSDIIWEEETLKCVAKENDKRCEKECGFGACVKEGEEQEEKETCRCFSIAINEDNSNEGKCVLNPTVCASGKLNDDKMTCRCEGKFKQASNGVTCEFKTCFDVGNTDCNTKGEVCTMNWKTGYNCTCPKEKGRKNNQEDCRNLCEDVSITCYNGECNPETGECKCNEGFLGKECEILPKSECEKKMKVCAETGGTCKTIDKDENVICECSDPKIFVQEKGCIEKCTNPTQCKYEGECKNVKEGEDDSKICDCKPGTEGDFCETIKDCKEGEKYGKCKNGKGECIYEKEKGKAICKCGQNQKFYEKGGYCDDIKLVNCKEICGENLDITCDGDQKNREAITCTCKNENEEFDKNDKKCKINYCKVKCGDAKCDGNKFKEEEVECSCTKQNEDFDSDAKTCKTNYCKVKCGDVKCEGNKFKEEEVQCRCSKSDEEFDGVSKTCKINYCKVKCGNAECDGNKFKEEEVQCNCSKPYEDFDGDAKACKINYCRRKCGTDDDKKVKCDETDRFNSSVKCSCNDDSYKFKNRKCIEKCFDDDQCKNGAKCIDEVCECETGTEGDFCETIQDCQEGKKYGKCRNGKGNCEFKGKEAVCVCEDNQVLYKKGGYCEVQCQKNEDCEGDNNICNDDKFCVCKKGWEGDNCGEVEGCKKLNEKCEAIGQECKFDANVPDLFATCTCEDGLKYYRKKNICLPVCEKNKCRNNRICSKDNFCECEDGYEGEDCSELIACKGDLGKKCEELGVGCIFDKESKVKATCNCKDGFKYDPKDEKCKHEFCYPVNRCKPANCTFDESTEVAYCVCPNNQFYSYGDGKCKGFENKCLLKKNPCGENEKCEENTGVCKCKYKKGKEDEECKRNFCKPDPCFSNANCSESEERCFCDVGKYYNNKKCIKANCNIKEYKTSCNCPSGANRKENGECEVKVEEKCEKDCGYGICKKVGKIDTCMCFTSFAERNNALNGTCTLKKSFCASGKLQESDPMKCKCEEKLKQAADGITCTLKTCDDKGVKEECESVGGKCVMKWSGNYVGYDCECPEGYEKDSKGKCTDPCSIEKIFKVCTDKGQVCYNSFSTNKQTSICRCPPTVELVNGRCEEKAANSYLFKNIPVLKKKYQLESGINKVLLNKHLVQSLQQTFKKELYDFGYLFDYNVQDDIVNCSVWVNFKRAPTEQDLKQIKFASRMFSGVCEDCDDKLMIWPPNLFLSSTGLKEAEPDKQDFCKVKDRLCGKGAKCTEDKDQNGKCTCDEGYQVVQYGILKIGPHEVQVCEDINECALGTHKCPKNTECLNTIGNYSCVCKEGFKKEKPPADPETDKSDCVDLCTPSPCKNGKCVIIKEKKTFDCECEPGAAGSYCQRDDEYLKSQKKNTVVVGAVLGTILIVGAIAVIYFIIKKKKKYGSEDFMPSARMDHAEMTERRHIRGITNKGYE